LRRDSFPPARLSRDRARLDLQHVLVRVVEEAAHGRRRINPSPPASRTLLKKSGTCMRSSTSTYGTHAAKSHLNFLAAAQSALTSSRRPRRTPKSTQQAPIGCGQRRQPSSQTCPPARFRLPMHCRGASTTFRSGSLMGFTAARGHVGRPSNHLLMEFCRPARSSDRRLARIPRLLHISFRTRTAVCFGWTLSPCARRRALMNSAP
jgi:hypothetical protein